MKTVVLHWTWGRQKGEHFQMWKDLNLHLTWPKSSLVTWTSHTSFSGRVVKQVVGPNRISGVGRGRPRSFCGWIIIEGGGMAGLDGTQISLLLTKWAKTCWCGVRSLLQLRMCCNLVIDVLAPQLLQDDMPKPKEPIVFNGWIQLRSYWRG